MTADEIKNWLDTFWKDKIDRISGTVRPEEATRPTIFINTETHTISFWDGSEWIDMGVSGSNLYYPASAESFPEEGNLRMVHEGNNLNGERYENGAWVFKNSIIHGSVVTDKFILKGLLTGFLDDETSLIRTGRQSKSVVVGEADHTLRLNGKGTPIYTKSESDDVTVITAQQDTSVSITSNKFEFF
ncbi:MAG: hypothetical protein GY775_01930, partial [Candidatus Scalindua sp.]|nr:hypothetical protein [Candidatus Scalindua sp.]